MYLSQAPDVLEMDFDIENEFLYLKGGLNQIVSLLKEKGVKIWTNTKSIDMWYVNENTPYNILSICHRSNTAKDAKDHYTFFCNKVFFTIPQTQLVSIDYFRQDKINFFDQ